jgi:curved DNA-binding protein
MPDYYEFLQISPNADSGTIHRVYRFLATRLHPDNPQSGDAEMFHQLKTAYDVLSNPERRAEYDATRGREPVRAVPWSTSIDFMDSLDGERNRRLAVLAVLYYRRRTNPGMPEVPLAEIESRMGFPRDYLDFTTWYLLKKGYVTRADNSEFTLTAEGVDFVETQRAHLPILNKLLTSGTGSTVAGGARPGEPAAFDDETAMLAGCAEQSIDWSAVSRNGHAALAESLACTEECNVLTLDRRAQALDRRNNPRGRRADD